MWYIPMDFVNTYINGSKISDEDIRGLRDTANIILPAERKPVLTVVNTGEHFFVVVLDFEKSSFYMLGKNIRVNLGCSFGSHARDLESWNGDKLWTADAASQSIWLVNRY
jgi:hypothetical protein